MHQNLGGRDHQGVGDGVIGDGDSFQPLGGVNEQRLAHHDAQGRGALSFGLGRLRIGLRARSLDLVGSLIGRRRGRWLILTQGSDGGEQQHHQKQSRRSVRLVFISQFSQMRERVGMSSSSECGLVLELGFGGFRSLDHLDRVRRWRRRR